jgi:hypothetical protein
MIDLKVYNYFKHFQNKDIVSLADMFSEDIFLQDWENTCMGKSQVIANNEKLFSAVDSIVIQVINLITKDNTAMAEIKIQITDQQTISFINVVDVIEFDSNGLITSVKAYKR